MSQEPATAARDAVRRVVVSHMPGYRVESVTELGRGLDNRAFEVNHELVVRFRDALPSEHRAQLVRNEAAVLVEVAGRAPLPVPTPQFVDEGAGCLAYFKLPGQPLINIDGLARSSVAAVASALGHFLGVLHGHPLSRMDALVDTEAVPLKAWRSEAQDNYTRVLDFVPVDFRSRIEAFLDGAPPRGKWSPVFSHNDLGIEHVLVDPVRGVVTGIIDWSDAAIVDPAYDFGLLVRDLGPAALDLALASYGATRDPLALRSRAWFYARCSVMEELGYGVEENAEQYVRKSLASLAWLFPNENSVDGSF